MSSPLQHSPRELKRLQRNLDEALANLAHRQRAVDRYGDDPVWAATVQRQLATAERQVAVARNQLQRKPVDVDAFLRTQIQRWEERTGRKLKMLPRADGVGDKCVWKAQGFLATPVQPRFGVTETVLV